MEHASFDPQAPTFEVRAGLPDAALEAMARAIEGSIPPSKAGLLLEVGGGTGRLARLLEAHCGAVAAFDGSYEMLRVSAWGNTVRAQADGHAPWPFASGCARAIVSSRALHLFDPIHAAEEALRLLGPRPGSALLLCSRKRAEDSAPERLRREMRRRLAARGISGKGRGRFEERLFERCCQSGAAVIEPVTVSSWSHSAKPVDSITNWRSKEGLAGREVTPAVKAEVLDGLTAWAEEEFGRLDEAQPVKMRYVKTGVRWP